MINSQFLLALSCTLLWGDKPSPLPSTEFRADYDHISEDGFVHLQDQRKFRLAGIKMRSVDQIQEPNALKAIDGIIKTLHRPVRIQVNTHDQTAIVYYSQKWQYRDDYTGLMRVFGPYSHTERANELLIVHGLAVYDPRVGDPPDDDRKRLKKATADYDQKLFNWARSGYGDPRAVLTAKLQDLEACVNRQFEFYTYRPSEGYKFKPRIALGDRNTVCKLAEVLRDSGR